MPQGELWKATPRDTLRYEAFKKTPRGQIVLREFRNLAMQNLEQRVELGYVPTAEELKDLEEWRREKAQQEAPSAE